MARINFTLVVAGSSLFVVLVSAAPLLPPALNSTENIKTGALDIRTVYKIENQGRGKVACEYSPSFDKTLCVTDLFSGPNSRDAQVATRVLVIDPHTFAIEEKLVSNTVYSSYLWGDFNNDSRPDFAGFKEWEENGGGSWSMVFMGTGTPGVFTANDTLKFPNPSKAGATLDFNSDGCEDMLVLGAGAEHWDTNVFTYYLDQLYRGDCRGGFTPANRDARLDRASGFEGSGSAGKLGRTSAIADINGDHCADLVVGNYRAQANDVLISDCRGHFKSDTSHPAVGILRTWYGHTVAVVPYDLNHDGALDLSIENTWHPDSRGQETDDSHVLIWTGRGFGRNFQPYYLEAPFGHAITDFNNDGRPEEIFATGPRWENYQGQAALVSGPYVHWKDEAGWLQMREVPAPVDLNLDGQMDLVADRRIMANFGQSDFVGLIFNTPVDSRGRRLVLSGATAVVTFTDGSREAFSIGMDGRGQPTSTLVIPAVGPQPKTLDLYTGAAGRRTTLDLSRMNKNSYNSVSLLLQR